MAVGIRTFIDFNSLDQRQCGRRNHSDHGGTVPIDSTEPN